MKRFLGIIVFTLALTFLWVRMASAQQPTPSDDEVNAIASQLFCPVCQNTPLDVCPTQACHDWRELIRQMLAEGKTSLQIKQYFVDHYGARVLSEPPRAGFNWLIYIIPPLAFLVGVYLLFRAYRIWRRPTEKQLTGKEPASGLVSDDGYVNRLEEELQKRK